MYALVFNIQYLSAPCAGCTLGPNCPVQHCQNATKLWAGVWWGGRCGGGNHDDIVIVIYIPIDVSNWTKVRMNHDLVLCEAGLFSNRLLHILSSSLPTLWSIQACSNIITNLAPSSPSCHPSTHIYISLCISIDIYGRAWSAIWVIKYDDVNMRVYLCCQRSEMPARAKHAHAYTRNLPIQCLCMYCVL